MMTSLPPSYGSTPIAHTLTKTREIGGGEVGKMRDGQVFGEQHSEWLIRTVRRYSEKREIPNGAAPRANIWLDITAERSRRVCHRTP